VLLQVLDDDARLGDRAIARRIVQSRHLADRPEPAESRRRFGIAEVHDLLLERRAVLVQRDQDFLTIGGERMEMERERHGRVDTLVEP